MVKWVKAWGVKLRSQNNLDGKTEHLLGCASEAVQTVRLSGYRTAAFKTRQQAREYIDNHYGYIKLRPDLRAEPHGWKMPIVVPINIIIEAKPKRKK